MKTARLRAKFAQSIEHAAARVAEHAKGRQTAKLGPTVPYGPEDRELFAMHILLELDGLREGIEELGDPGMERALFLVLSAILTKVSLKAGDASSRTMAKRLARGYAIRFFTHKAHDLALRLVEAKQHSPRGARPARVELTDARRLGFVADRSVDLIVTSPPYPGVYDYYNHHALRMRWLRLDGRGLSRNEIGPRRAARKGAVSIGEWERDFTRVLEEMRRVLKPGGKAVLLVADSSMAGRPLEVEQWPRAFMGSARQYGASATGCEFEFQRSAASPEDLGASDMRAAPCPSPTGSQRVALLRAPASTWRCAWGASARNFSARSRSAGPGSRAIKRSSAVATSRGSAAIGDQTRPREWPH